MDSPPDETRPGAVVYTRVEDEWVVRVIVRETIDGDIVWAVQDADHHAPRQWRDIQEYPSRHEAVTQAQHDW